MYFLKILGQTLETFKQIRQDMTNAGVSSDSPIFQLLSRATFNAENGTCSKYTWATRCGVTWDGITYGVNNPCATTTTATTSTSSSS